MTNLNFSDSASQAIHDIIIGLRYLAYKNTDPQILARILDRADPLTAPPDGNHRATDDQIAQFRQRLQDIEDHFAGFEFLVAKFDQNMKRGETKSEPLRELVAASA